MNNRYCFLTLCLIVLAIAPSCKKESTITPTKKEKTNLELGTNPIKTKEETSSVLKF